MLHGGGGDGVATCENIGGKWNFSWQYFQSKQFYFFAWIWSWSEPDRDSDEGIFQFVHFVVFSSYGRSVILVLFIHQRLLNYFWGFEMKVTFWIVLSQPFKKDGSINQLLWQFWVWWKIRSLKLFSRRLIISLNTTYLTLIRAKNWTKLGILKRLIHFKLSYMIH